MTTPDTIAAIEERLRQGPLRCQGLRHEGRCRPAESCPACRMVPRIARFVLDEIERVHAAALDELDTPLYIEHGTYDAVDCAIRTAIRTGEKP